MMLGLLLEEKLMGICHPNGLFLDLSSSPSMKTSVVPNINIICPKYVREITGPIVQLPKNIRIGTLFG